MLFIGAAPAVVSAQTVAPDYGSTYIGYREPIPGVSNTSLHYLYVDKGDTKNPAGPTNPLLVYCFNATVTAPTTYDSRRDATYIKSVGDDATFVGKASLPITQSGLEQLVLNVLYNGYPNDKAALQSKYGLNDQDFHTVTQQAVWALADSEGVPAESQEGETFRVLNHVGAPSTSDWTPNMKLAFYNLLGIEKRDEAYIGPYPIDYSLVGGYQKLDPTPASMKLDLYLADQPGNYQHLLSSQPVDEQGKPLEPTPSTSQVTTTPVTTVTAPAVTSTVTEPAVTTTVTEPAVTETTTLPATTVTTTQAPSTVTETAPEVTTTAPGTTVTETAPAVTTTLANSTVTETPSAVTVTEPTSTVTQPGVTETVTQPGTTVTEPAGISTVTQPATTVTETEKPVTVTETAPVVTTTEAGTTVTETEPAVTTTLPASTVTETRPVVTVTESPSTTVTASESASESTTESASSTAKPKPTPGDGSSDGNWKWILVPIGIIGGLIGIGGGSSDGGSSHGGSSDGSSHEGDKGGHDTKGGNTDKGGHNDNGGQVQQTSSAAPAGQDSGTGNDGAGSAQQGGSQNVSHGKSLANTGANVGYVGLAALVLMILGGLMLWKRRETS